MRSQMDRKYILDLAARGLKWPIGTDLVLHEHEDAKEILLDGRRLGEVFCEAARRYRTPLAIALMDLTLEKESLLAWLGVPEAERPKFHFAEPPTPEMLARIEERSAEALSPRLTAQAEALHYVAEESELVPVAMAIGPFSLMTKLLTDPIVPVYLAGSGLTGEDDPEVLTVERCLELAARTVRRSLEQQIAAGAQAIMIAEPAANQIYISPGQMAEGSDVFDRFVMSHLRGIRDLLAARGVQFMLHCCGEITPDMLRGFCSLDLAMLSLGSSRKLWEDAAIVPKTTVLYGNLPSKKFFSDSEISPEQVRQLGCDLLRRMREAGHPFILGSECDVMSVEGCEETLRRKVTALMECT